MRMCPGNVLLHEYKLVTYLLEICQAGFVDTLVNLSGFQSYRCRDPDHRNVYQWRCYTRAHQVK